MLGDRTAPALSAGTTLAALAGSAYAIGATALVARRSGLAPDLADLVAGLALVLAAVVLADRGAPRPAALLGLAAVAWFAVDLATVLPHGPADVAARAAYLPVVLVAHAALRAGRPRGWPLPFAAAVATAYAVAALAALGVYRGTLVVLGVAVAAASLAARPRSLDGRAARAGATLGIGTAGVAAARLVAPEAWDVALSRAAYAVITAAALLLAGWAVRRGGERVAPDADGDLGAVLGAALGVGPLVVAFRGTDGGLLDPAGRPTTLPDGPRRMVGDGAILGRLPSDDVRLPSGVEDLLVLAASGARLRAELRGQLDELAASRDRLVGTADEERRALEARLRAGPLAQVAAVRDDIPDAPRFTALLARVAATEAALEVVARGLDPVPDPRLLGSALRELADAAGAAAAIAIPEDAAIPPACARATWFVCAEALANAAKHAPGATVEVAVRVADATLHASVRDDGPGGADRSGSGLRGLADRAASLGGTVAIRSGADGTRVSLVLPIALRPGEQRAQALIGAASLHPGRDR